MFNQKTTSVKICFLENLFMCLKKERKKTNGVLSNYKWMCFNALQWLFCNFKDTDSDMI